MAYDLETARVRIGLAADDTSQDVIITSAMTAALSFAEKYCDRKFMRRLESEEFIHFNQCKVQLIRYPVESIGLVDADEAALTGWHIDKTDGRLVFDGRVNAHILTVDYMGGYAELPADLEMALWRLFDIAWSEIKGGSAATGTGQVKAISSAGAKIEFAVSGSAGSGGSLGGPNSVGSAFASSILDFYKRVYA